VKIVIGLINKEANAMSIELLAEEVNEEKNNENKDILMILLIILVSAIIITVLIYLILRLRRNKPVQNLDEAVN